MNLDQGTTEIASAAIGHPGSVKRGFWVKCSACKHTWIAAYLPMELNKFAKVAKASCPMCAAPPKKVFVAKQKDGVLMEQET